MVALGKASSSQSLVFLDDMHIWASTMQPGKVFLGNMVTLSLTKTEGVHCSSAANGLCIMNTFFQH